MSTRERIEVRLLGPTTVRRRDGSLVAAGEWRTSKTLDLLRLLALERDKPVRAGTLVDKLWSDVEESRGKASLRTAASHLRRVLGPDSVERIGDSLVLRNAWVDTGAFGLLAAEASSARRAGQLGQTVAAGTEAEGLYLNDFEAHDRDSSWAQEARNVLCNLRRNMLIDAAESAVELGWFRDALELGRRLVEIEPTHEGAHRVIIAACAGLGRDDEALRAYERIRILLRDELGVTPSPTTRELHARAVSGRQRRRPGDRPVVGNPVARARLAKLLAAHDEAVLIELTGPAGSGRKRLLADACAAAGRRVAFHATRQNGGSGSRNTGSTADINGERAPHEVVALLLDREGPAECLSRVATVTGRPVAPRTVVAVVDGDEGLGALVAQPRRVERVEVHPLSRAELAALAEEILGSAPDFVLLNTLQRSSGGLAARAADDLDGLLRAGRTRWSPEGVTLIDPTPAKASPDHAHSLLRAALPAADEHGLDLVSLMGCLDGPVSSETLAAVLGEPASTIRSAVGRLTDMGLLRVLAGGVDFHSPSIRAEATVWTRPAVRSRLHAQAAASDALSSMERVRHWLAAGQALAACDFAVLAASRAFESSENALAEELCARAEELVDGGTLPRSDAARIRAALDRLRAEPPAEPSSQQPVGGAHSDSAPDLAHPVTDALELLNRLAQVDRTGSAGARFSARMDYLGVVLVPGRRLESAQSMLEEAESLARSDDDRARVLIWRHLPAVLLDGVDAAREALGHLVFDIPRLSPPVGHDVLLLDCLVAHRTDRADLPGLLQRPAPEVTGHLGISFATVKASILVQRGRLDEAMATLAGAPRAASPLDDQLRGLAWGGLHERLGHPERAREVLRRTQTIGIALGCRLLLPEATARLIGLEASNNHDAAVRNLELLDDLICEAPASGIESVYQILAQSSIQLESERPERSLGPLTTATQISAALQHPQATALCHIARADCLTILGHVHEAEEQYVLAGRHRGEERPPAALSSLPLSSLPKPGLPRVDLARPRAALGRTPVEADEPPRSVRVPRQRTKRAQTAVG